MPHELDRDDLLHRARRIVEAGTTEQDYRIDVRYADALPIGLRAVALLRSCIALIESEETAGLGVIVRTIYEEWLFGLLYLEGKDEDQFRLFGAHFHGLDKLARMQEQPRPNVPENVTLAEWKIEERARRLDQIRGTGTASEYYKLYYRSESFTAAHAGFGSNRGHVGDESGRPALYTYEQEGHAGLARLAIAILLTAELMTELWKRCGLDPSTFEEAAVFPSED